MTKTKRRKSHINEVLGNLVISKNFLRTRKIMVMHSNERGECCLRTQCRPTAEALTQHRGSSRTSSRSNRSSTETTAHVQLDDDPRTPIQQSVGEEFRQHDSVVTILMYYCRRASPKHRYNIIEDYGGRGHSTRLRKRSPGSTCLSRGAPAFLYKGAKEGCGRP